MSNLHYSSFHRITAYFVFRFFFLLFPFCIHFFILSVRFSLFFFIHASRYTMCSGSVTLTHAQTCVEAETDNQMTVLDKSKVDSRPFPCCAILFPLPPKVILTNVIFASFFFSSRICYWSMMYIMIGLYQN